MAWNRKTESYVSDDDVDNWERILRNTFTAEEFLHELILCLSDNDKATFFSWIAQDYDIELPVTNEEENNNAG